MTRFSFNLNVKNHAVLTIPIDTNCILCHKRHKQKDNDQFVFFEGVVEVAAAAAASLTRSSIS
jgi:hypothetical protein